MLRALKAAYRQFKRDKPGERFVALHKRWASEGRRGVAKKILASVGGAVLIAVGVLLGLVPGVPGIVLAVAGMGLIGIAFRPVAAWMDRLEVGGRRFLSTWAARLRKFLPQRTDRKISRRRR